ncbi:ABC transporter permease [Thermohalobacter berrensis]|uniref:Cell division protein FtsX n=1 Tax=Thermohalobacter berrensis TaxID=99594 RepID=A0A419TBB9_9FIRM|nr:ABC transporter permease [Thermohalobacter berrensis]RKD34778.1 cell division protein FtsX [Thermohalobacter berrensis]
MVSRKPLYSFLIRWWFSAKMAFYGIISNPLRSTLTILGVAIGVASVVSLMGIGEGARRAVVEQFKSYGTNVIDIKANDPTVEFEPNEAEELVGRVEGLVMATPVVETKAMIKWRRTRGNVNIVGVNNEYPKIKDHKLLSGHFFTQFHIKQRSPVAVLGYNLGVSLLNGRNPVGYSISLNGETYRILGVLEPKGEGKAHNIDNKILIPYTSALKIANKRTIEEIWGKAASKEDTNLAVVQLGRIYKRKLGLGRKLPVPKEPENPDERTNSSSPSQTNNEKEEPKKPNEDIMTSQEDLITITNLNQLVKEVDNANRVMTLLLGGIAAVSLLVGGLGIMNIMLVAVTERTEEIGVRRALGAKQSDLLIQFLLEALYVSVIGIIAGIATGIWGLNLFENYGFQTAISIQAIKVAIVVALTSGLLFGVYPAVSASSVSPVEALKRQ